MSGNTPIELVATVTIVIALVTAGATVGLLIVNTILARAARTSADVAAEQFRIYKLPLITVKWQDVACEGTMMRVTAEVHNASKRPVILHNYSTSGDSVEVVDQGVRTINAYEELAADGVILIPFQPFTVPENVIQTAAGDAPIATLSLKVVVSTASVKNSRDIREYRGRVFPDPTVHGTFRVAGQALPADD